MTVVFPCFAASEDALEMVWRRVVPIKNSLFIRNQAVMKTLALEKFNGAGKRQ
ncbi:hypothetical protein LW347_20985 [Pectobacterium polonicum]|uniref:Uncharacterized protein n=1 Tax=Pectobacterium polonicum TaxID=2485124 RepID=A0AAE9SX74_9GAMM|nr:hypothetical protein [Pectobacterium polonicum]UVO08273.1 hypothetical protein LW347_20985 [Pectobacterium polonicum]